MKRLLRHISRKIADLEARIVLSMLYIIIAPLFVLIAKVLKHEKAAKRWRPWGIKALTLDDLKRQF